MKTLKLRKCFIYGIRNLGSAKYVYIGSTIQDVEIRVIKHFKSALKGTHENKLLAKFLLDNKFQVDILAETIESNRAFEEYEYILMYHNLKHPLLNRTDPRNPRKLLNFKNNKQLTKF